MAQRSTSKLGGRVTKRKTSSVRAVQASVKSTPRRVDELFSQNLLQYHTPAVYAWFQKRHEKGLRFLTEDGYYDRNGHRWRVPYGVRYCLTQPLMPSQISNKYPFMVTWRSSDRQRRLFKRMQSLPHAIVFVAERAQYVDSHACILNRQHMDIPPAYRNKIPAPFKWCPRCMKPRRFHRLYDYLGQPQTFYGTVKVWHVDRYTRGQEVGHWEYPEKKLAMLGCEVCGCTNRDSKYRRSNQTFHTTVVKKRRRKK